MGRKEKKMKNTKLQAMIMAGAMAASSLSAMSVFADETTSVLHILSVSSGSRSVQLIERIGIVLVFIFVLWESVAVFKKVSMDQIIGWHVPAKARMATGAALSICCL